MKHVLLISHSYQTGGAAIVAQRLLKALRKRNDVEARLLVMTDDIPHEERADDVQCYARRGLRKLWNVAAERAGLWLANGLSKSRAFQIDTSHRGYRLDRHPWVEWADVIHLHWINQGTLSLRAVEEMARRGRRIVWTLHDMWPMTGICHHAYDCTGFHRQCRQCPHLLNLPWVRTVAKRSLQRKERLYDQGDHRFVCVSQWEMAHAQASTLLHGRPLTCIANPYPIHLYNAHARKADDEVVVALGAARLDDPVKGFDLFLQVSEHLAERHPDLSRRLRLVLYGTLRDRSLLQGIRQRYEYLGLQDAGGVRHVLEQADICLCPSRFESLSNALVEGAAAGCILVSFVTGGQADVMRHGINGYAVAAYDTRQMADCVAQAATELSPARRLAQHEDVAERFAEDRIAQQYMEVY